MMKKIKTRLAAACLCLTGMVLLAGCGGRKDSLSALRESGKLRVALVETGAPFMETESGEPQGTEVDLALQTANALGINAEYMIMDRNEALEAVASGEADLAMGGFTENSGSDRGLIHSVSYGKRFLYLVTGKDDYVNSAADLDGETIGICGAMSADSLNSLTLSGNIRILGFDDARQAAESLKKGEIRGFFCYQEAAEVFLDQEDMLVQSLPFLVLEEYSVLASPDNSALISGMNVLIEQQLQQAESEGEDDAGGGE